MLIVKELNVKIYLKYLRGNAIKLIRSYKWHFFNVSLFFSGLLGAYRFLNFDWLFRVKIWYINTTEQRCTDVQVIIRIMQHTRVFLTENNQYRTHDLSCYNFIPTFFSTPTPTAHEDLKSEENAENSSCPQIFSNIIVLTQKWCM